MAENIHLDRGRSTRLWPTIRKGMLLGVLASAIGSAAFVLLLCSILLIRVGLSDFIDLWYIAVLFGIVGSLALAITILPAIIGGGANALALYVLGRRRRLTIPMGLLVGTLSGLLWGLVAVALGGWFTGGYSWGPLDPKEMVRETLSVLPVGLCICTPIGCWHGWRMARYLRGRSSATRGTESANAG